MEGKIQTETDVADSNKANIFIEIEHVNKKFKLSEPGNENIKLCTDVSNNEPNDIEMSLIQENQSKSCSSGQKILGMTSERVSTTNSSKSLKHEPEFHKRDDSDSDEYDENLLDKSQPEEGFNYPLESDASDMLDEVDSIVDGRYPTVTERYFTPYYQLDVTQPGDDICILIHTNRICMFTLAPSHIIYQENKKIVKCDYQVTEKLDRLKNKVSGKAKHGAQALQNNSNLCRLTCDDNSVYTIKCCIIGKLVEVNERLVHDPELLKKAPHYGGYIGIALPNLKHLDKIKSKLLNQKRYEEALNERKERAENDKSKKSGDTLIAEGKEVKNKYNYTEPIKSTELKEVININESEAKVDAMEIVES